MNLRWFPLGTVDDKHANQDTAWLRDGDRAYALQVKVGDEWQSIPIQREEVPRPYYFSVVVWGKRYLDYLLDWCVPSLLAPRNVPALKGRGHKLLIACPDEDWPYICKHPSTRAAQAWLEICRIPIARPDAGANAVKAMGTGHKLIAQACFKDRARGIHLTPDMVVSDGLIETVQRCALEGAKVVLTLALRYEEGAFFAHLHKAGIREGVPLSIPPRTLAGVAMRSMHPETKAYEWGREGFAKFPASAWQPVEDGMICCGLSWASILFDYGALKELSTHTLEHWSIDGDFVYRNFGDGPHIRQLRDTDEGLQISWTPLSEGPRAVPTGLPWADPQAHYRPFGKVYNHPAYDPLKRRLFWSPVRWHPGELTQAYADKETALLDEFGRALGFDWRRMVFVNTAGEAIGDLHETMDQYETRARRG